MPNGPRLIIEGACYHIMIRGNQKQAVFKADKDRYKYLYFMAKFKKKHKIKLYGYCLMPNHVHIVGKIEQDDSLSMFMHALNRTYTGYFNTKYQKVGHLWQGRFKSKVIVMDKYLIDCINYIECNPVRAGLVISPHEYVWSSYNERSMLDVPFNILDEISI